MAARSPLLVSFSLLKYTPSAPVNRSPWTRPRTISRSVASRVSANATAAGGVPTWTVGFSFHASVYEVYVPFSASYIAIRMALSLSSNTGAKRIWLAPNENDTPLTILCGHTLDCGGKLPTRSRHVVEGRASRPSCRAGRPALHGQ